MIPDIVASSHAAVVDAAPASFPVIRNAQALASSGAAAVTARTTRWK